LQIPNFEYLFYLLLEDRVLLTACNFILTRFCIEFCRDLIVTYTYVHTYVLALLLDLNFDFIISKNCIPRIIIRFKRLFYLILLNYFHLISILGLLNITFYVDLLWVHNFLEYELKLLATDNYSNTPINEITLWNMNLNLIITACIVSPFRCIPITGA